MGEEVDDQQAGHAHQRQQRRIDPQLELGVVDDVGGIGVAVEPLGVSSCLRACEFDLLNAGKQVALHADEGIVPTDKLLLDASNCAEVKHHQQCLDGIEYGRRCQEPPAVNAHLDEIDDGQHAP